MDMAVRLAMLFDYQRFMQNEELAEVITDSLESIEAESSRGELLSDDDMFLVAAAGETDALGGQDGDGSDTDMP